MTVFAKTQIKIPTRVVTVALKSQSDEKRNGMIKVDFRFIALSYFILVFRLSWEETLMSPVL